MRTLGFEIYNQYPDCLYKFKSGKNRDILSLFLNNLWIPNILELNDCIECNVSDYPGDNITIYNSFEDEINSIKQKIFVLSLSEKVDNKVLFNYYANGFKGFVVGYSKVDLENLFNEKKFNFIGPKKICYHDQPYFIGNSPNIDLLLEKCFEKTTDWQQEKEIRYVIKLEDKIKGFYLTIKPKVVIVGNRMEAESKRQIQQFCNDNNIGFYEVGVVMQNGQDWYFE